MTTFRRTLKAFAPVLCAAALLASCGAPVDYEYPTRDATDPGYDPYEKRESVFGEEGIKLFGDDKRLGAEAGGGGIGVNAFLWRATLDTITFMPITSADPFGGTVITDWHSEPDAPNERFKLNIFILGRALRADGVRVSVFRQTADARGWADAETPEDTSTKIEDAILTRARLLRSESQVQ
ncbi:MAG: DUF3576 domain-containing protein [Rhodospirillales bacterium]